MDSNKYENSDTSTIMNSSLKFQEYIILDKDTPGIKEFLAIFNQHKKDYSLYSDTQFPADRQSLGSEVKNLKVEWKRPT